MIMIAAYWAARLAVSGRWGRPTELDADGLHVVMGVAMAGMLLPRLSPLPASVWAAVFALAAAWFTVRAVRLQRGRSPAGWLCRHPVAHLIECAAMLYMLFPATGLLGSAPAAMPGMSGPPGTTDSFRVLAVVLALFMLGYIIWTADMLAALTRARAGAARLAPAPPLMLAPRLAGCCKIAMGMAMGYMLVQML
jgi:hypothetical protein